MHPLLIIKSEIQIYKCIDTVAIYIYIYIYIYISIRKSNIYNQYNIIKVCFMQLIPYKKVYFVTKMYE